MSAAATVTVIIALVVAAALAYYLIRVVIVLGAVNRSLSSISAGVRVIADRTEPLGELLTPIKEDLETVASAIEGAVASLASDTEAA